jgi:hypothetical protein
VRSSRIIFAFEENAPAYASALKKSMHVLRLPLWQWMPLVGAAANH